ncbi:MAG: hypothetical protein QME83_06820 [Thermodesulfobacteriota bacterium]|nr:hypothetical protein [Thermodesulfobacteriota bacterium]
MTIARTQISDDRTKCERAFNAYRDSLKALKLIPHDCPETPGDRSGFWKEKSKMPYRWGDEKENGYPWIGFLGYEIHYDGHVRIRKKSLKKEMQKQYEVTNEVRTAVKGGKKKVTNKTIEESVINRLIGMAVVSAPCWSSPQVKSADSLNMSTQSPSEALKSGLPVAVYATVR